MISIYFSHPVCQLHNNGSEHPEAAERLSRIEDTLIEKRLLDFVLVKEPRAATVQDILRVHSDWHWHHLLDSVNPDKIVHLDNDTNLSKDSIDAALYASGAVLDSVDALLKGDAGVAFCNVRPPGHHAEVDRAMGFCLINHVAIGAAYAIDNYGLERVAILDFDVHHGNGTESYARQQPKLLFASSYEEDIYPFPTLENPQENLIKMPLKRGDGDEAFLNAWRSQVWPRLREWQPQLIILSAGFDAHRWDPLAGLDVSEAGFNQWTHELRALADELCGGKVISVLEGGYELTSLALSVVAHFKALTDL